MTLAHLAGVPLEELLLLAPAAGPIWLALRVQGDRRGAVESPTDRKQS